METKPQIVTQKGDSVRAGWPGNSAANDESPIPWREAVKRAVRSGQELARILNLDKHLHTHSAAERDFPVFVPWEFLGRMQPENPQDPLLLQAWASPEELAETTGFHNDPVGDAAAKLVPGLIRKYRSRALLITTGACAIHCRYCFRRHFPYEEAPKSLASWQPALEELQRHSEIDEVILSGGDPLMLVDDSLHELVQAIAEIPHIKRVRVHTRLPIVIPQRVTDSLIAWLTGTRLTPMVVVHVNHAQELDAATAHALTRLVNAGVPLLNQTVLLRGVNDNVASLVELSQRLVDLRVMPYYLHQLDRVRGAAHFEVPLARGFMLVEEMRKQLPGYAVPRYVQEVAGDAHKRILS